MAKANIEKFSVNKNHTASIRRSAGPVFRTAAALLFSGLTMHCAWAADGAPAGNAIPGNETVVTQGTPAEEKMKALIDAGIFSGGSDNPELSETMNRAQFAKIAALIMGLDSGSDAKPNNGQSFSDIDFSNVYAIAMKEIGGSLDSDGLLIGNDSGITDLNAIQNVITQTDFASIFAHSIGEDGATWATQFVASAIAAGLLSNTGNELRIVETVYELAANASSNTPPAVTPPSVTPRANWPTALNATYVGTISGALTNATPVTGSLTMNVDFANISSMVPNIPGNIIFDNGKGSATFNLVQMGGYVGNSMTGTYNGEAMNGFIRNGQFYGPAADVVKGDWDMTTHNVSGSGQFSAAR